MARYIKRSIDKVLVKAARQFPAVVLTGPRQSGKSTTLKHLFGDRYKYVSLELPDVRSAASVDPRGFLEQFRPPVIFDEVQYAADLLPYIKERIDEDRDTPGQYLLTGSQNLMLLESVTETLAGRAAVLRLMPFSLQETLGKQGEKFPWETRKAGKSVGLRFDSLWKQLIRGGYPEPNTHPGMDTNLWYSSYIQTYLERDVRMLRQVGDLTQFQSFLTLLASRSAQLFSLSGISSDLGISVNTVKAWLSVLEATHQIMILRPYFANIKKRLVKSPKVYFTDTGTLCHLTGIRNVEHATSGPLSGAIMETAVLSELMKRLVHRGSEPRLYFWRTSSGSEVDFIIETDRKLIPIEVKVSATPRPSMASTIGVFREDLKGQAEKGFVIHPGDISLPMGRHARAIPLALL